MNSCPNCHQGLNVSSCQQANLLYCTDCQWGLISFDEALDSLMDFEEELLEPLSEQPYLAEAI